MSDDSARDPKKRHWEIFYWQQDPSYSWQN